MQRRQNEIKIIETPTEYLLSIPPKQRDRAKNIRNDWDGVRRCWVYPRNIDMYYALIREFADDLTSSSSFTNPQEDEEKWQSQEEIDYLRDTLLDKEEIISDKDDKIKSLKTKGERKDRENSELQEEIDHLRGIAEGINSLDERLSNKDDEIQLLNDAIGERNRKNNQLNRQIDQLKAEINNHKTTIDDLSQTLSEKDGEIKSLSDAVDEKDREDSQLRMQITQLQDINTHPGIRDIAVEATGNDPVFGEYFRTLNIDRNLPVDRRSWLEELLIPVVDPLGNMGFESLDLNTAINQYSDFDRGDELLAHVIRTQGNLSAHPGIDERTRMGRALCCFFAAALLAPKLSKADHTNTEPLKSIKPTPNDAEVHYSYGLAYRKKGDHDRAIAEYTKAIALKPDHAGAYRNRGTAYYHKGNYASAIKDYTKAIALRPNYAEVYYDRGTVYYRKGDYNRAIAEYTKAIELKPNYVKAYNNRGHAHQQQGDSVRAQADFDKAEQLEK